MLRGKVQPFKLKAEEVSRSSIRYLDLLLTKTGTRFVARPAFKTTSHARPLDPTSAHPKFVRCSWPVGMVKRIFPLCSREADVLAFKEEPISRLQAKNASKCTIARVVKASPWPERTRPREKEKQFRCMQGALETVAEQNQITGHGTRLVDVTCGEESDTPQGSEPVAKQARTDDYSMNVGQVTPPVVPGREAKGPEGSEVEFLRQLVREQQAQLNEAVRAANAATQAAAAATQAPNAQQTNLALMQASTAHAAGVAVQGASMSTVAVSAMDPSRAPAPVGQAKSLPKDVLEGLERVKVSFLRDLKAHQRALRREARAKSDVDSMGDPSSRMRYPAGMKGFTLPDNQIWLDECWKTVAEQCGNHTVEIPRGTSRRDAATLIHRAAAKQIRAIDHEGLQAHRETLDMKASKEAFISSCKIMLTSLREVQRDARLGLEVPQQETLDQTLVEVKSRRIVSMCL